MHPLVCVLCQLDCQNSEQLEHYHVAILLINRYLTGQTTKINIVIQVTPQLCVGKYTLIALDK